MLFLPTIVFGQSGEGYINYKSYKTHYGNGSSSTYNGVTYGGGANSTAEFDAMVDTNQPGTSLTHSGEVSPYGSTGLAGGLPSRWGNDYYAVVYSGWFKPNKSGTYRIRTKADDSNQTRYREVGTTTWQTMTYQWGCCSWVYGTAALDNTKWYEFEFRYQEYGGGAYYNFYYSIPANGSSPIYNQISTNHQFGTWTNVDPSGGSSSTNPEVDLDLESVIAELESEMEEDMEEEMDMPNSVKVAVDLDKDGKYDYEGDLDSEDEEEIDLDEVIRTLKEMEEGDYNEEEMEEEEMAEELEEAYKTIASLKKTINEVNLLNAKLLYTNKLFRTFDLNENQKVKVLENFDRTSSVREVKLVFSTLAENLNVVKKKKVFVKEGYASKPTKSSEPKKIISEGNELAARWKKLAGLK